MFYLTAPLQVENIQWDIDKKNLGLDLPKMMNVNNETNRKQHFFPEFIEVSGSWLKEQSKWFINRISLQISKNFRKRPWYKKSST